MNEEATPLNTKKLTKFGCGVFRGEFNSISWFCRSCYDISTKKFHITDTVLLAVCLQLFTRVAINFYLFLVH